jgi:predicted metal-dependent hydrolase
MQETEHTLIVGEATVSYTVVRSRRRTRTVSMSLDRDARIIVRAPAYTSMSFVHSFVHARSAWIARQIAEHRTRRRQDRIEDMLSGLDITLPYRGVELPVVFDREDVRRASVTLYGGTLWVVAPMSADNEEVKAALIAWYKSRALQFVRKRVEAWTGRVGRAPSRILIRSQKTQWGSCGEDGTIRFNWQLAMADPKLLEYVVVHEMVHLRIRHHGASFWRRLGVLLPTYELRRAALRDFAREMPL